MFKLVIGLIVSEIQGVPGQMTVGEKFKMSSSIICLIPKRIRKDIIHT